MQITVFTPTYNRGYIIENLYHSLQRQTYQDFEWLVIDDGSTDNTEQLFEQWQKENNFFQIIYKKVDNGGKHRAINKGIKLARGELFFIVDSDDRLTKDALEIANKVEKTIDKSNKHSFCGVCGLRGFISDNSKAIGTTFNDDGFLDITAIERQSNGITGDKAEIFYTEILRKYPFPEFEGEKFITECVVWNKMAHDGLKLRYFNEIIYFCDYLEDGLTYAGKELFIKNPQGWGYYIRQDIDYGLISGMAKWDLIHDYYKSLKGKLSFGKISGYLSMGSGYLFRKLFRYWLYNKFYDYIDRD